MCLLNDSNSCQESPSVTEDRNLGCMGCNKYQCRREMTESSLHLPTLPLTLLHGHGQRIPGHWLWPPGSGKVKGYMTFSFTSPQVFLHPTLPTNNLS